MKIAVLGTGMVGTTIASKLVALGHDVKLGSRTANSDAGTKWVSAAKNAKASTGTFGDAARFGEIVFHAAKGEHALEVLNAAGTDALAGKILVDISNPLDFSKGMPPTLFVFGTDSLAETIQRAFPATRVVKTLNTVNANMMVDPSRVAGTHTMFLSGNDAAAKGRVQEILTGWFGWKDVVDLGGLTAARGQEAYLLLWLQMWGALKTADFNVSVVRV